MFSSLEMILYTEKTVCRVATALTFFILSAYVKGLSCGTFSEIHTNLNFVMWKWFLLMECFNS
jgi:hypothetical protein